MYGFGSNDNEQLGVEGYIGIEMSESVRLPLAMNTGHISGKTVEFDVSENVTILRNDDDTVWWQGMKLTEKPTKLEFDLKYGKPISVCATERGLAVATGNIFFWVLCFAFCIEIFRF